jgi:hypothetical protein
LVPEATRFAPVQPFVSVSKPLKYGAGVAAAAEPAAPSAMSAAATMAIRPGRTVSLERNCFKMTSTGLRD